MMKFSLALFVSLLPAAFAAFGVTRSGSNYIVDTGGGLVTTSGSFTRPDIGMC